MKWFPVRQIPENALKLNVVQHFILTALNDNVQKDVKTAFVKIQGTNRQTNINTEIFIFSFKKTAKYSIIYTL